MLRVASPRGHKPQASIASEISRINKPMTRRTLGLTMRQLYNSQDMSQIEDLIFQPWFSG